MKTVKGKYVEGTIDEINGLFAGKTTKPALHTPTPWHVRTGRDTLSIRAGEDEIIFDFPTDRQGTANAAFIVRAVNCHEKLIKACKAILTNNVLVLFPEDEKLVREAIAAAEGL